MESRRYGTSGPLVIVLHGGPGAPGHMAPVARGLEDAFRVIEPFQRGSGEEPLTVARHVEDLADLVREESEGERPALVGSSWGAMLALAFAAEHPDLAGPLVLVGCGTFDPVAREKMRSLIAARWDDDLILNDEFMDAVFCYDAVPETEGDSPKEHDERARVETWDDMVRLQEEGVYPQTFSKITSPVLMLHGDYDPHPGNMIRGSLVPHIPHLEYREWMRCGHYPWREKWAREEFFLVLREWLTTSCSAQ